MTIPVPTEKVRENRKSGFGIEGLTCLATFTKSEPCSNLGGGFVDKVANHLDVVARHNHLLSSVGCTLWPMKSNSDIGGAQEQLRTIIVHERSVSAALLFREDLGIPMVSNIITVDHYSVIHINLGLELLDSLHGSGCDENHSSSDLLTLDATQQGSHVISSLTAIEFLAEHLNTSQGSLEVGTKTDNFNIRAFGDDTSLNASSGNSTTTRDGKDICDECCKKTGPITLIGLLDCHLRRASRTASRGHLIT